MINTSRKLSNTSKDFRLCRAYIKKIENLKEKLRIVKSFPLNIMSIMLASPEASAALSNLILLPLHIHLLPQLNLMD